MSEAKLQGLILAGGQSRRMGRDKAMIPYHGMPQYQYLAGILESFGIKVFLSTRKNQALTWNTGIPMIHDVNPNLGPLGGLLSAHLAFPSTAWIIVACDFVYLEENSVRQLIDSRCADLDITAFRSPFDNKPEPFFSIWEPNSLSGLHQVIKDRRLSARSYMADKRISLIKPNWPEQLQNVNSESDIKH